MAEETKTAVRLSKAAKEFNIGVQTVIEFLGKKGHEVDSNPNSKLTAEQYALLAKEYQGDKAVRQEAENIDLGLGKKKAPITVEDVKNAAPEAQSAMEAEDEELRIKKVSLEGPAPAKKTAKTAKAKAEPKAEEPAEAAEKPAKKTKTAKAAAEDETPAEPAPVVAAEAEQPEEPAKAAKKPAAKKKETATKTTAKRRRLKRKRNPRPKRRWRPRRNRKRNSRSRKPNSRWRKRGPTRPPLKRARRRRRQPPACSRWLAR